LHNEKLHDLSSTIIIVIMEVNKLRRIRWMRYVRRLEAMGNPYKILTGKSEGRKQLCRHKSGYVNNVRIDRRKICHEYVGWMHLDQVGTSEHGNETFRFLKRRRISWLVERLLASQEALCYSNFLRREFDMRS
jgi:hypothetical protein